LTEKLYQIDSCLYRFQARIVNRTEIDGHPAVLLDKTAFYPTSGGQMNDRGTIENVRVLDVVLRGDDIWHICENPIEKEAVTGYVDWQRRFDFMQQHTGFHLLAQSFLRVLKADTLSSHLGEDYSTIDVQMDSFTPEHIDEVEVLCNRVIWENRPIRAFFVDKKQAEEMKMRKSPENFEQIRVVDIENFDLDPCGGTHVSSTGQVGIVKVLNSEKVHGIYRFTFVAGQRAVREFQHHTTVLKNISALFTTGVFELEEAVKKSLVEQKMLRRKAQKYDELKTEQLLAEILSLAETDPIVMKIIPDATMDTLRRLASQAMKQGKGTFLLGATGEKPCIVFSTSEETDLRPVFQQIIVKIDGRGGGAKNFVQGGGTVSEQLTAALEEAKRLLA
jgi:alanyl-tRNA synthetase